MPQYGIHVLIGAAGTRRFRGAGFGFLLGSLFPDLDFVPLVALYPFNRDLAIAMHRRLTHSLLLAAAILLVAAAARAFGPARRFAAGAAGFAGGMTLHVVLDLFFWFAPPQLLWPLATPLDGLLIVAASDPAWNLIFAWECGSYALFLWSLRALTGIPATRGLKAHAAVLLALSVALTAAAPFLARSTFEPFAYGPALAYGLPVSLWYLWTHRHGLFGGEEQRKEVLADAAAA